MIPETGQNVCDFMSQLINRYQNNIINQTQAKPFKQHIQFVIIFEEKNAWHKHTGKPSRFYVTGGLGLFLLVEGEYFCW